MTLAAVTLTLMTPVHAEGIAIVDPTARGQILEDQSRRQSPWIAPPV
jgi:hypothetical protein